eukprot:Gb_07091 [translate_table: standard]
MTQGGFIRVAPPYGGRDRGKGGQGTQDQGENTLKTIPPNSKSNGGLRRSKRGKKKNVSLLERGSPSYKEAMEGRQPPNTLQKITQNPCKFIREAQKRPGMKILFGHTVKLETGAERSPNNDTHCGEVALT